MNEEKRKSSLRLPAKASFYYIVSTIVGKGIGLILTPIFTRVMSAGEYGYFSYYISLLSIASLISSIFLSPAVIYSGLGKFNDNKLKFENATIILSFLINIGFCTLLFAFNRVLSLDNQLIAFILVQNLFDSIIAAELLSGKFTYDYIKVVTINLLSSFLAPILSLFLIFIFKTGARGRILGLLISAAFISSILLIKRLANLKLPEKDHLLFLLKNSIPLFPATIARAIMGWSDKLIVKSTLGVEVLAKYSVAHTVGMGLFGLIGALSSALNPWMIRKLSRENKDSLVSVIKSLCELISFGSVIIIGLAPEIFSMLAPDGYIDALYAIIPFAISTVPFFLFSVYSVIFTYLEKTKLISIYTLVGAGINLTLNLFLIKSLGYIGGAVAYLTAEGVMCLMASASVKKEADYPRGIFVSAGFSILFSILFAVISSILYPYLPARLILLIIPACLIVNRGFICIDLAKEK